VPEDELEARFTRLEHERAELRERVSFARTDAASARVLAAGADRDVSEVREEMHNGFATLTTGMARIADLLTETSGPGRDTD
jgi:hypothetical protein